MINSKEASAGDGHDNRAWIMQYMDAQGSSDVRQIGAIIGFAQT